MRYLLAVFALVSTLCFAQSQELISGPPTETGSVQRDICTWKGVAMYELFKYRNAGVSEEDLAAMLPNDNHKAEQLEILHAVFQWPDAPSTLVKMTYAQCMGYKVH